MARSISVRAKPIASIWTTAPSAAEPMVRAEGSPKAGPLDGAGAAPAGDGVAGATEGGGAAAAWGAGGGAGVDTGARAAGVEGTWEAVEAAALGC